MTGGSPDQPTWFGHPRGLTVLFLTEMWEKFSFYGMRALLVYYMTKQLLIGQAEASLTYGLYTAFVYLTPIAGGYIADRWLGARRAVAIGGAIMAAGHFMMASEALFHPALLVIALGNGLFLPGLPSQIPGLYAPEDPRKGRAFSVYYVGINLGAFLAPLACGTVGELYGWHFGFGLAGLGMVAGLTIYLMGQRYLPAPRAPADTEHVRPPAATPTTLLAVGLSVVVFRGAYEQVGNTLALWADKGIDRATPGLGAIPATWFQSVNPMLVFLLTPVLISAWSRAAARGRDPAPLQKMAIGAGLVAAAYLALAVLTAATVEPVSWIWLVAFLFVLTLGELFILPVGLGLFAASAPRGLAATATAAWFLAAFAGNLLAGAMGALWTHMTPSGFFGVMAAVAGLATLALLLARRTTRRSGEAAVDAEAR